MLKNLIVVSTLLMSGSVFAEAPDQAPDFLYYTCLDVTDRTDFRAMRNLCDDDATEIGYNIGIFRPYNENLDGVRLLKCIHNIDKPIAFSCLGSPHKKLPGCEPPCDDI